MDARRVYSNPVDRASAVICDQRVVLNGFYSAEKYPNHLRRIRFNDPETGRRLVFLTNNTALPALTIAALYKSRWQIELFFKWIKQHLQIKRFLATIENAVKSHNGMRPRRLCPDRDRQERTQSGRLLYTLSTDSVGLHLRENPDFMLPGAASLQNGADCIRKPTESIRDLTGQQ